MNLHVSRYPARGLDAAALVRHFSPAEPCVVWESSVRQSADAGAASSHSTASHTAASHSAASHTAARFSILGIRPTASVTLRGSELRITKVGSSPSSASSAVAFSLAEGENPLPLLAEHFPFLSHPEPLEAPPEIELPAFRGGLLGFFGYDCGRYFETIRGAEPSESEPDIFLLECPTLIIFDRERDEVLVTSPGAPTRGFEDVRAFLQSGAAQLTAQLTPQRTTPQTTQRTEEPKPAAFTELFSREEFCGRVRSAKEYICAGDIFQVVLSNTFRSPQPVDPVAAFDFLRRNNPSAFHFLVRFGDETLVGASPEVMLRGRKLPGEGKGEIAMRLVAGTYPKGERSVEETRRLGADRKELAEHLMLVDHARNDIGRVAKIGGVTVEDLFSIETYADVHHIVSQVRGELRPEENLLTALQSCFPIATLTGTPKIRAMEIIAELEGPSRGIFGGAVAVLGYDGTIDSAVAIRSLVTGPAGTVIRAGAGIVYDSIPEREYEECRWKAKAMFAAAGAE